MIMYQAIVWIDAREAQVLRWQEGIRHELTLQAPEGTSPHEPSSGSVASVSTFFEQLASALESADELLVVGPSATRHDFVKYMHQKDHGFDARILGIETVDSPDDRRLTGYASMYFTQGGPRRSGQGSGYRETD